MLTVKLRSNKIQLNFKPFPKILKNNNNNYKNKSKFNKLM